jgi:hypothetical protein
MRKVRERCLIPPLTPQVIPSVVRSLGFGSCREGVNSPGTGFKRGTDTFSGVKFGSIGGNYRARRSSTAFDLMGLGLSTVDEYWT